MIFVKVASGTSRRVAGGRGDQRVSSGAATAVSSDLEARSAADARLQHRRAGSRVRCQPHESGIAHTSCRTIAWLSCDHAPCLVRFERGVMSRTTAACKTDHEHFGRRRGTADRCARDLATARANNYRADQVARLFRRTTEPTADRPGDQLHPAARAARACRWGRRFTRFRSRRLAPRPSTGLGTP